MYNIEEANAELAKAKGKNAGAFLSIEGKESMTRTVPEIPPGLIPGEYRFAWNVPDAKDATKFTQPISGSFTVYEEAEIVDEPSGIFADAERLAEARLKDRESFYEHMLLLNNQAQERIEKERERVWELMEARLTGMQKIMLEQVKNQPSVTVERPAPEKSEWWEGILEKYGEQLAPVFINILANAGAKNVNPSPAGEL